VSRYRLYIAFATVRRLSLYILSRLSYPSAFSLSAMNSASVRIALWPITRLDLFYTALVFEFKAAPEETGL
jgi:hypothetical protein